MLVISTKLRSTELQHSTSCPPVLHSSPVRTCYLTKQGVLMLRRIAGPVLVGAGIFLVVLAALLPTVVYPRIAVLPADPRTLQIAHGSGFTVFLPRSVADGGLKLYRDVDVTSKVW